MDKKPTLTELYNSKAVDIRESYIPKHWLKSFHEFMIGSTYYRSDDGENMYYAHDFVRWYQKNQEAIKREEAINSVINE